LVGLLGLLALVGLLVLLALVLELRELVVLLLVVDLLRLLHRVLCLRERAGELDGGLVRIGLRLRRFGLRLDLSGEGRQRFLRRLGRLFLLLLRRDLRARLTRGSRRTRPTHVGARLRFVRLAGRSERGRGEDERGDER